MAFDPMPGGGGGPHGPWCTSCRALITPDQRKVEVRFDTDPHGHRGLTGMYHEWCSKPFQSLAHVINLNWFGRF